MHHFAADSINEEVTRKPAVPLFEIERGSGGVLSENENKISDFRLHA